MNIFIHRLISRILSQILYPIIMKIAHQFIGGYDEMPIPFSPAGDGRK
jgi:hypothetical protein